MKRQISRAIRNMGRKLSQTTRVHASRACGHLKNSECGSHTRFRYTLCYRTNSLWRESLLLLFAYWCLWVPPLIVRERAKGMELDGRLCTIRTRKFACDSCSDVFNRFQAAWKGDFMYCHSQGWWWSIWVCFGVELLNSKNIVNFEDRSLRLMQLN